MAQRVGEDETRLPFVAAILLFLANPVLVFRAKRQVRAWMAESEPYAQVDEKSIPDYLAPTVIEDYI